MVSKFEQGGPIVRDMLTTREWRSQGIRYEVLFCLRMLKSAFGWESPIHFRLVLLRSRKQVILDLTGTKDLYLRFAITRDMKGAVKAPFVRAISQLLELI